MKHRKSALVLIGALLLFLGACSTDAPELNEFEGQGRIRGSFRLGGEMLEEGWVEMIELSGPPSDRCGPGDCGLAVKALAAGWYWNPGRLRVIAPPVMGWKPPPPFEVVVVPGDVTRFQAEYEKV